MSQATLMSDVFPKGVVIRMSSTPEGKFTFRWQFQEKPYTIEASTIEEGMRDTMLVIQSLENQDGPV